MASAPSDSPRLVIAGTSLTAVFHLWKEVSVEDSFEVSNKSARGSPGVSFVTARLPSSVTATVICSDELIVPTVSSTPNAVTQGTTSRQEQVDILRGFVGSTVTIDARTIPMGVTGVITRVRIMDDGKWDNAVEAQIEMQQVFGIGPDGTPDDLETVFGKIVVPVIKDESLSGGGDKVCQRTVTRLYSPQVRAIKEFCKDAGATISKAFRDTWTNVKKTVKTVKKAVSGFFSSIGKAVKNAAKAVGDAAVDVGLAIGVLKRETVTVMGECNT